MKLQVQGREAYAYTGGKPFDASLPSIGLEDPDDLIDDLKRALRVAEKTAP